MPYSARPVCVCVWRKRLRTRTHFQFIAQHRYLHNVRALPRRLFATVITLKAAGGGGGGGKHFYNRLYIQHTSSPAQTHQNHPRKAYAHTINALRPTTLSGRARRIHQLISIVHIYGIHHPRERRARQTATLSDPCWHISVCTEVAKFPSLCA